MRIRVLGAVLLAVLAFNVAPAAANVKMPFWWARKESKVFMDGYCIHHPSCVWWKVGHCARFSRSRVDCGAAVQYRSGESCSLILVNKTDGQGYLAQRARQVRCE